jgi:hypothetical protein
MAAHERFSGVRRRVFSKKHVGLMSRLSLLLSLLGPASAIDPAYAVNITVYHVNQATFGAAPVNMDTG